MQHLAGFAAKGLGPEHGLDPMYFVVIGDRREAHDFPRFLRQNMALEVVPRVTPEGKLSCGRCMISTIARTRRLRAAASPKIAETILHGSGTLCTMLSKRERLDNN
jgi:hypothetical protein